jgi:hypothetical protein
MKYLYFSIFVCFLSACKSSPENHLRFAYQETYVLSKDEKTMDLTKQVVDVYEQFNGLEEYNLPLNKYVYHPDYVIYFSVAMDNNAQEVVNMVKRDSALSILEVRNFKDNLHIFCKKGDDFAIKYIFTERKEQMPVMVHVVARDSVLIKKLYDDNSIVQKIR